MSPQTANNRYKLVLYIYYNTFKENRENQKADNICYTKFEEIY